VAIVLSVQNVTAGYGSRTLFENVTLAISDGDRVGMIGPNGAGKSTLLRVFAGLEDPDEGARALRAGTRLAVVPQIPTFPHGATVDDALAKALEHEASDATATTRIAAARGRAAIPSGDVLVETLSGGWRKRLAIACALVRDPDVVLFDEPTNHLDLEGVLWLERLIKSSTFTALVISHDRMFLENVATRVVELNRVYAEGLFAVDGAYSEFLQRRSDLLVAQAKQEEALANKVRREIDWLRRGPKARTSKSKARIDEAGRLISELADARARSPQSPAGVVFDGSGRRTKQLLVAAGIAKSMGGRLLWSGVDMNLGPGTRLGVLGLNGSGKTTLLRVIAGELEPDRGTIQRADPLAVVMFDQAREQLDLTLTLRQALTPAGGDSVVYRDRVHHVAAWARRFLFRTEQLDVSLDRLSGGEQARVLIARLMLRPADVLILDEPTNDLDIETLEVLEDSLTDFPGALVLVTHDRYMLDRISGELLALDGEGGAERFADYSQWEDAQARRGRSPEPAAPAAVARPRAKSMSYKEKQELEAMEARIMEAENEVARLEAATADPAIATDAAKLAETWKQLEGAKAALEGLWARWSELEDKKGSGA
jgi:ATP-binding cassette subfamily F protein uup